jgi:hypothetical protein
VYTQPSGSKQPLFVWLDNWVETTIPFRFGVKMLVDFCSLVSGAYGFWCGAV